MDKKLKSISVKYRRPTEHTTWRPRIDHWVGGTTIVWGVFSLTWER